MVMQWAMIEELFWIRLIRGWITVKMLTSISFADIDVIRMNLGEMKLYYLKETVVLNKIE